MSSSFRLSRARSDSPCNRSDGVGPRRLNLRAGIGCATALTTQYAALPLCAPTADSAAPTVPTACTRAALALAGPRTSRAPQQTGGGRGRVRPPLQHSRWTGSRRRSIPSWGRCATRCWTGPGLMVRRLWPVRAHAAGVCAAAVNAGMPAGLPGLSVLVTGRQAAYGQIDNLPPRTPCRVAGRAELACRDKTGARFRASSQGLPLTKTLYAALPKPGQKKNRHRTIDTVCCACCQDANPGPQCARVHRLSNG